MKRTETGFYMNADRYRWDCGECSSKNGFAQLDTSQDAPYYGAWANPTSRIFIEYCEGDFTKTTHETDEEFIETIREFCQTDRFRGIDPGWNISDADPWKALGLTKFLHESYRKEE